MKTEFETRFLEVDKADLLAKLKALKAADRGESKLDEIIFYDKELKWLDEHRLIKLRKKGDVVSLTYKQNKNQQADSAQEIEFVVSSMDEAAALLKELGLVAYRTIEKYRHSFKLDGVTLDIDTWPKIPTYVELEGNSVEELQSVARKLGLAWENRFDKDPRYVFKRYGFDFDKIRTVTFNKFG